MAVYDLAGAGDYLYVILDGGVGVLDLSIPSAPNPVAFYSLSNLWEIAVDVRPTYMLAINGGIYGCWTALIQLI
ncbi:MAG: hypothetical protein R2867_07290 [Caldilineaceae bacterium]